MKFLEVTCALLLLGLSSGFLLKKRSDQSGNPEYGRTCLRAVDGCSEELQQIAGNKPLQEILADLRLTGIRSKCPIASKALQCLKKDISSEICSSLSPPIKANIVEMLHTGTRQYETVCIEQIDEIEANKECIFSDVVVYDLPRCFAPGPGIPELCDLSSNDLARHSCIDSVLARNSNCRPEARNVINRFVEVTRELNC